MFKSSVAMTHGGSWYADTRILFMRDLNLSSQSALSYSEQIISTDFWDNNSPRDSCTKASYALQVIDSLSFSCTTSLRRLDSRIYDALPAV